MKELMFLLLCSLFFYCLGRGCTEQMFSNYPDPFDMYYFGFEVDSIYYGTPKNHLNPFEPCDTIEINILDRANNYLKFKNIENDSIHSSIINGRESKFAGYKWVKK